jgi:hypothetical protein
MSIISCANELAVLTTRVVSPFITQLKLETCFASFLFSRLSNICVTMIDSDFSEKLACHLRLLSEKAKALLKNRPPLQLAISKQKIFVHS